MPETAQAFRARGKMDLGYMNAWFLLLGMIVGFGKKAVGDRFNQQPSEANFAIMHPAALAKHHPRLVFVRVRTHCMDILDAPDDGDLPPSFQQVMDVSVLESGYT
jgi:hypothetical protein